MYNRRYAERNPTVASEDRDRLPDRSELTEDQRWNIETIFASVDEWEAEHARLSTELPKIKRFRGRLGDSPAVLLEALEERDRLSTDLWILSSYAFLRQTEDAANATFSALADRASGFIAQAMAIMAYIDPEVLAIERERIDQFIAEEPKLATFEHYFKTLDLRRDHTRSSEIEEVLAAASDVTSGYSGVRSALENADLDFGTIQDEHGNDVQLGPGNLLRYLHSSDRDVRRSAWISAADAYVGMRHTFAGTLSGGMKRDVFYARAHNYETTLEAVLQPDATPVEVFHNLIETVWKNLPTWRRYFRVRRRALGLDTMHEWDITAPLVEEPRHIPYREGVELIAESLEPLGEEYVSILRQGITDRWVDPYANRGKHGGAFSGGTKGTYPFISMSYDDDFQSVSTLAHELGHSMHSYYTWETQPEIYADYGMMVAETASNMHQALLGKKLLAEIDDPSFLIEIIEERMSNHLRYFFTMPILARFELDAHTRVEQGQALTADWMSERIADLYEEAYGGEVVVDRERMGITWARFPHLFQAYYVYNYALGIAAAAELSNQVLNEGQPAVERYLTFLKSGSSKFQLEVLCDAGVDLRDPAPVQAAFDILAGYVDRLENIISTTP